MIKLRMKIFENMIIYTIIIFIYLFLNGLLAPIFFSLKHIKYMIFSL